LKKPAFTLFELIIVVVLIGIIYAIVLSNFHTKKEFKILKLENLKESLLPLWKKGNRVDLILYDEYKKAALVTNGEINSSYKPQISLSFFKDIESFTIDRFGALKKIEFAPLLVNSEIKKVDFRFTLFQNGSSSSYIIKKDENYYLFFPYFEDVNITQDSEEAIERFTHKEYRGVSQSEINE
jgi:prepilin-type N-terminal cleavage/methylation domain-containing protein